MNENYDVYLAAKISRRAWLARPPGPRVLSFFERPQTDGRRADAEAGKGDAWH